MGLQRREKGVAAIAAYPPIPNPSKRKEIGVYSGLLSDIVNAELSVEELTRLNRALVDRIRDEQARQNSAAKAALFVGQRVIINVPEVGARSTAQVWDKCLGAIEEIARSRVWVTMSSNPPKKIGFPAAWVSPAPDPNGKRRRSR